METTSCITVCALGTRSQHVAQAGLELTVLLQFLKGCTNVSEQSL